MNVHVTAGALERIEVDGCDTVPKLFWHQVKNRAGKTAFREKDLGIWRSTSWTQYGERARAAGMGLAALGLRRGDVVSILAETIPEWLYADMGTMGAGGISNGIYPTDSAKQVEYICNDSRSRFIFVENEEQLDKFLEVRGRCTGLEKAIVFDMEGLVGFADPQVISFEALQALGREHDAKNPGLWEKLLAEPKPEDLAILVYTSGTTGPAKGAMLSHRNIIFQLANSDAFIPYQEGEEQLDKFLEVRGRCTGLEKAIVFDMEGLVGFADPQVTSFEALQALGREHDAKNPGLWEELLAEPRPEDLAILVYTSGTTGPAKGAMLSHRNIIFQLANSDAFIPYQEGEEQLAFLPLCHVAERTFTAFLPLRSGAIPNFAESIDTVTENIREVAPTFFFAVPRIWERFYSGITIRMKEATWFGRKAYEWAIGTGLKVAEHRLAGTEPGAGLKLMHKLADYLVLDNIKRVLGLQRIRWAGTGAAPISPDLIKWYMALGIDMREVYGQTENCGLATGMPSQIKLGTVGTVAPRTEVKISPEGEILLKGPHVFMGYLNQPEKTAETVKDGWLHTGDVGLIDNQGYVKITDRMKDIIITAGGKNITPSEIENQLKFSPYISDAVVIGDKRKFLSCLIMIDYDNVSKHAQDENVPFTDFGSLCRAPAVLALIETEIERVNKNFARVETIKKFRLIEQQLTPEDDEVTPTMKLKRKFVSQKYKDMIDGMYVGA